MNLLWLLQGNAAQDGGEAQTSNNRLSRNRKKLTEQELETLPLPLRSKYLAVSILFTSHIKHIKNT